MAEYDNEGLVGVEEYRSALERLRESAEAVANVGDLSKEEAEKLRRRVALDAMKARQTRRDVFLSLERRKHGVAKYSEQGLQQEANEAASKELLKTGNICLDVIAESVQKITDIEEKLSVDIETFHAKNPLPEGTTESKCDLLKRRIQYELDLSSEKASILSECQKERVQHTSALKGYKKFFQAAIGPLEELITKVQKVHTAVGGLPDALGGLTPSHLPIALYTIQQSFIAALGPGSVSINGSVNAARSFIKAGKFLAENSVATELYPLTLAVKLKPSADDSPVLKFYFRPSTQKVVAGFADTKRYDHTILMNASSDAEEYLGLFHEGVLVTGVTAGWICDMVSSETDDTERLLKIVKCLLEQIEFRQDVNATLAVLKSRSCLSNSNIMSVIQRYLPSFPAPKVVVGDVKLESEVDDKKDRKSKQTNDGCDLQKTVQFKIELDSITYKVVGLISSGFPTQHPQFKLRVRRKDDDDKRAALQVPSSVLALAAPVEQLSGSAPSVPGVQCSSKDTKPTQSKKRKRRECSDYSVASVEAGYINEIQEYFLRHINIEVVKQTPLSQKGQTLMRQILMSVYFVQAVHPYVLRKGVASGWMGTQGTTVENYCTQLHDPSAFKLMYHNPAPLFRGREVQLPIHWDANFLKWGYKQGDFDTQME